MGKSYFLDISLLDGPRYGDIGCCDGVPGGIEIAHHVTGLTDLLFGETFFVGLEVLGKDAYL